MDDIAETLAVAASDTRLSIHEIAEAARVLLRAQNQIDRRIALDRFDAARSRLDTQLAALRGDLVRIYVRDEDRDTEPPPPPSRAAHHES
jgi:hypothetical protein